MNSQSHTANTTIIVVCWNAIEYTKMTLKSMFGTVHIPYNLVIVDNHSTDGTPDYLSTLKFPKWCINVKVVLNKRNIGYGRAINLGYKKSVIYKSKYICVCNNDLFFQDRWLEKLESSLNQDKDIGILGTLRPAVDYLHYFFPTSLKKVVDSTPNGLSAKGELKWFLDGLTFEEAALRIIEINGNNTELIRCPPGAVITCCAIIRADVIKLLGYLADPIYKTYGSEDVDLSWSISKLGYKCAVLKGVYVHHFRHKSINASHLNRNKYLEKNNQIFFDKWSQYLYHFLINQQTGNFDLKQAMNTESNHEYWILRRLNENIHFWDGDNLVASKFNE